MINLFEVAETNKMIEQENLDVRTITIGISLLDCMDHDIDVLCKNIYNKITTVAKDLVKTGEEIEKKYGIPIVNKRISVTPISFPNSLSSSQIAPKSFVAFCNSIIIIILKYPWIIVWEIGVNIKLQHENIFNKMHRI